MRSACCLCVYVSPFPSKFWMPVPVFMTPGAAPEPFPMAHFINSSWQTVCPSYRYKVTVRLSVSLQRLGKHVPAATNTCNNRRIVGPVIFYVVRVLSKDSLSACLFIPLSLLGNNSVKTFPRQWRIVGGVVFYAVRIVSKEIRRLFIPRTFC
jgi:hypothetical protein